MKKRVLIFIFLILFFAGFSAADIIEDNIPIQIQTLDSNNEITTGTFTFKIDISDSSTCSPVLYSDVRTLTTDSRGIVSYNLPDVDLNFDEQYWFCYYRDSVLKSTIKAARVPYTFRAKKVDLSGVDIDTNLAMGNYTVSANYFIGDGSYLTNLPLGSESDPYWTGNQTNYFNKTDIISFGYYNISNFNINDYALNSSLLNYYLASNPFGFYNETNLPVTSSVWNRSSTNVFLSNLGDNVGIGTSSPLAKLHINSTGGVLAIIGNNFATGISSIALGSGTNSSGGYSIAMGQNTIASGGYSTAMGQTTLASGVVSTAMGYDTNSLGDYSTAIGFRTNSSGYASTSMGLSTLASGSGSTATGYQTEASGSGSTAMGRNIIVKGDSSFGIGLNDTSYLLSQTNTMAIMGGKVGIGTTSPAEKVEIKGGSLSIKGSGAGIRVHNPSNDSNYLVLTYSNDVGLIRAFNSHPFYEKKIQIGDGASVLLSPEGGKVGIGTTTPEDTNGFGKALDVQGLIGAGAYFRGSDDTTKYSAIGYTNGLAYVGGYGAAVNLSIQAGGSEKMRINSEGNVGIGTTSPSEKLSVSGGVNIWLG